MEPAARPFELLLFSVRPKIIVEAMAGGVRGVMIDMETRGKQDRQAGFDTQINQDTYEDIRHIKRNTAAWVITRVNGFWDGTADEVQQAIDHGADEILLPMVRTVDQVESALKIVRGQIPMGIFVETANAVQCSRELSQLPLSRVYVGLNDLAIDRQLRNIFTSVADGTLDEIRSYFHQPFGFGGLTLPDAGSPIPCRLLISENARLKTQFSFLRRSYFRDTAGKDLALETPRLLQALRDSMQLSQSDLERDHRELARLIDSNGPSAD
jgi:hypothetical protein